MADRRHLNNRKIAISHKDAEQDSLEHQQSAILDF